MNGKEKYYFAYNARKRPLNRCGGEDMQAVIGRGDTGKAWGCAVKETKPGMKDAQRLKGTTWRKKTNEVPKARRVFPRNF
jgi:hypothetical protein